MDYRETRLGTCFDRTCGSCGDTRVVSCQESRAASQSDMTIICLLQCIVRRLIPIIIASYFIIAAGIFVFIFLLIRLFLVI